MERLHRIKEHIVDCVLSQVGGNLKEVDTKELGEAVDIIKDLSEAIYYCTITEAMDSSKEDEYKHSKHSMAKVEHYPSDYNQVMRYSSGNAGEMSAAYYPHSWESQNESASSRSRKNYMEGKIVHHDKNRQIQELETYMSDLSKDLTEMIQDASAEEKQMLQQKLQMLAAKIK